MYSLEERTKAVQAPYIVGLLFLAVQGQDASGGCGLCVQSGGHTDRVEGKGYVDTEVSGMAGIIVFHERSPFSFGS